MRLDWLLPDKLVEADDETASDATVIYECRNCGSKFDEDCDRCTVCGATEIATYTFRNGCDEQSS